VDQEILLLEQRVASLIAHVRALRAANEELRRELASAQDQNRALVQRMQVAGNRLEAALARLSPQ
jgi:cell division septum initiation protein DivIVA